MIVDQALNVFFTGLRERRSAFKESSEYFVDQLAPDFNVFDLLRPSEIDLSEIISLLLNPLGAHSQGSVFLHLFIDLMNERSPLSLIPTPSAPGAVKVACESATDRIVSRTRRIDIEIGYDNCGIAIENKPWAADGADQLKDYAAQMEAKYPRSWLVYLSGYASSPSVHSLPAADRVAGLASGRYIESDYRFIRRWLDCCESLCKADRVRHFIRDFKAYCDEKFLGEERMLDAKLVRDYCMQSHENLATALTVAQQANNLKEELVKGLPFQLQGELLKRLPDWQMEVTDGLNYASSRWKPIAFSKKNWRSLTIAFEFDLNDCRGLAYGVRRREESVLPDFALRLTDVNRDTSRAGQQSLRWPWWTWAEPKDWWFHVEPWIAVADGSMAVAMIDRVVDLARSVETLIDTA